MIITLSISAEELVTQAMAEVETMTITAFKQLAAHEGSMMIDIRDVGELQGNGTIAGAVHIPRGMLEFVFDPESPYYCQQLDDAEKVLLYCTAGARSALATKALQDMGVTNIAHLAGGLNAWLEAGEDVASYSAAEDSSSSQ